MNMAYKKGQHCNLCIHSFDEMATVYNPNHGGNPGSTDYEEYRLYCCANNPDGEQIYQVRYNCPIFQAANTASTGLRLSAPIVRTVTQNVLIAQIVPRKSA
jgi:hypothetical protein